VSSYVARLSGRLADDGIAAPLLLMKSSGGVIGAERARRMPVETVLSGPAAGAVGAAYIGAVAGYRNLIGIDIGGTSADITLVHDGEPGLTTTGHIGEWPLALPMIDITTIGTPTPAGIAFVKYVLSPAGLALHKQGGYTLLKPQLFGPSSAVPAAVNSELGG